MANSASVAADAVEEASTSGKDASSCHFHPVPPSKSAFQNGMVTSNLTKWGLLPNLKVHRYRYDRSYHKTAADQMLLDMFNDPGFRQDFRVMRKGGQWGPLEGPVHRVINESVPATVVSMSFFDRLEETDPPIVHPSTGHLRRVMDDQFQGVPVANALQEYFLRGDETDYPDLFSPGEASEFIACLLRHLVLGGAMNQYDDRAEPYMTTVKAMYKDLVSVVRPKGQDRIDVLSVVYRVVRLEGSDTLFPSSHVNNFCYVVVDTSRETATLVYGPQQSWW